MLSELGSPVNWESQEGVVQHYAEEILRYKDHLVLKDPQFEITARLWIEAGVDVDFVAICLRNLEVTAKSWSAVVGCRSYNDLAYGAGMIISTCIDYAIPFTVLRFPDFVTDSDSLYHCLKFPKPVSEKYFNEAFYTSMDESLVHRR